MTKSQYLLLLMERHHANWLTLMLISTYHFDLSPIYFRDALALTYHRPLLRMLACCDGCGAQSSLEYALDCKKRGLVTQDIMKFMTY